MQMDEILAQDSRHQASEVHTPSFQRAASMAIPSGETRRSGAGMRSGQQVVVLLVRKAHQGKQPMGQHDEAGDDRERGTVFPERPTSGETLDLSEGERSLIYRRRMGFSQKQMAALSGVKRRRYSEMETEGTAKCNISIEPLTGAEQCLIWRRRSGWTQQSCADLMGITRYWYNLMENGKVPSGKLEAFWNER